ncbi:protein-cysteine N-palmitoyltransferase HHAT-like [Amblyomma americanum]
MNGNVCCRYLRFVHWTTWIGMIFYAFYIVVQKRAEIISALFKEARWFCRVHNCRQRDHGDSEWEAIVSLVWAMRFWLLAHAALAQLIAALASQLLQPFYVLYSLLFATMCFPRDVWVKGIIMLAASFLAVSLRRRSVVYAVGFALVADATIDIPLKPRLSSSPTLIGSTWSHGASVYFVGWHVLRCVSVTADILDGSPRGQPRGVFHTCLRALAYLLYFPGLIIGPVTNYDDFMKEPHRPSAWNHKRLLELLVRGCRLVARFFIMEAFLRWAYVRSALLAPRWYLAQSGWTLAGLVWLTSLQFYLKYNFAYGLSSLFFWMDGVYERHDLRPLCTVHIHTASNTWRYFDKGLYKWIVR